MTDFWQSRAAVATTLAISLAGLLGCVGDDAPSYGCPRVEILPSSGTLTRFAAGSGRDLVDVDFQAEIADIVGDCAYAASAKDRSSTEVNVAPVIVVSRGPANRTRQANFNYFVAVINRNKTILNKQEFTADTQFPGTRSRVLLRPDDPPITVDIPAPPQVAVRDYRIIIGLQLTEDELKYNERSPSAGPP